jgi:hypothetical protein
MNFRPQLSVRYGMCGVVQAERSLSFTILCIGLHYNFQIKVLYSELLGLWTFSIVQTSKY